MTARRRTVVVSGMIAAVPHQGGATWAVLQYLLGLRLLRHDVYFVEQVPPSALRPGGCPMAASANARYFHEVMAAFEFERTSALLLQGTEDTVGLSYPALLDAFRRADVLINIAGTLDDARLMDAVPIRAYLDLDPGFTQFWAAADGIDMKFEGHTHFVTIGCAIGRPECPVPTCGLPWIPTLQPIALPYWPPATAITHDALTTVGHWRSYGSITHGGVFYGQKAHALRELMTLPRETKETLALAMAIDPGETGDLDALRRNGWRILDPSVCVQTPSAYQAFIQGSKGEIGIAKSGYVSSRSGWFSDRSVCYLASGRPVVAADTGFSAFIPAGVGVLPFQTQDDLLRQIDELNGDYARHARQARVIAEEYFDSSTVLTRLLDQVGAAS